MKDGASTRHDTGVNEQLSGQKERIVNVDALRGPGMSLMEAPRGRFALAMQTIGFRFSPICPHLFLLEFDGHTLVPDTPLYRISEAVDRVEVTPGRFKTVPAPTPSTPP